MADLAELYQQIIIEHNKHPRNFRQLDGANRTAEGDNPLCGDRITMMLAIDEAGTVSDVAFTGRGCAISQASASLLTDRIRGKPLSDVARIGSAEVLDELGIEISPARLKCALLSLDTLQKALDGRVAWAADGGAGAPDELSPASGRRATS